MIRLLLSSSAKSLPKSIGSYAKTQNHFFSVIKFTRSHEYIKIDGNIGTVGITEHAANALGDVVFVDLPSVGAKYSSGESFGSVESVKAASDVYSPVEGEVIEVNSQLDANPGKVNESPFEDGWFIKIKLEDTGLKQADQLLDEAVYKNFLENSEH